MRFSSKHIAAVVASAAVVAAFGIGAFALAQSGPSFDPQQFTSAYSKGQTDADRGYQANPIDTDAQANREKDDANSDQKTTETERPTKDVFTNYPLQGPTGTSAYNVTGNAELGGIGIANEGGSSNGNASAGGGNAGGAVVVKPDSNGNGNAGGGDKADDDNNGGSQKPGGGDKPGPSPSAPDSYDVLPTDPGYEEKDTEKNGDGIFYKPVNGNNSSLSKVDPAQAHAVIMPANTADTALYTGQKLNAWMVFCALSTFYYYNGEPYAWTCSKDEFASYPYFRVDDFPKEVPNGTFPITVSYRFNDADTWHTETIEYEPAQSCTFIVTGQVDESGNPVVLTKVYDSTINLLRYTEQELEAVGYLEYGMVSNMLLGWKEGSHEVGPFYTPEPGRHVIEPAGFAEVPEGYSVDTYFYFLNDKLQNDFVQGTHLSYLQRLYLYQDNQNLGGMLVGNEFVLNVPLGVQAVEINEWFGPVNVGRLVLPSTTLDVQLAPTGLVVWDSFAVDAGNPTYATTPDGILTSKDGTQYLGVPMNRAELDVPNSVSEVKLQSGNDLQKLVLRADDASELPYVNLETLNWCNVVIADDMLDKFVTNNTAALNEGYGNTLSLASEPSTQYRLDNGKVYSDDLLKFVVNTGSNTIFTDGLHTIASGCFEGNGSATTIVLSDGGDYAFEADSLAGSAVATIVCQNEAQRKAVQAQLDAAGAPDAMAVLSDVSTEGYRYFTTDIDGTAYTTLLTVPEDVASFTGSFTAADGTSICPDAISAGAFANNTDLEWAILADKTSLIGARAFAGCTNLQGVFISNPDTATLGADAFDECYSLRFIASRAMYGDFTFAGVSSYNCQLLRPTGSDGTDDYINNFQYFTPESGVTEYELVQLDDGGYVLYGCDDDGPWLAISSGSTITGQVTLPQTTTEIFLNSFKDVQGDFTVNWRDLKNLMYVDGSAFANSTVSGEVYVGTSDIDHVSIASDAFSNCQNITSVVSDAPLFDCASWAFSECENLTSVRLAVSYSYDWGFVLGSGVFYGCKSLETIQIDSWNPSSLLRFGKGSGFRFDGDWDNVDEWERIRLIVPDGSQEYYLHDWLFAWLGYDDYDQYYSKTYENLYTETGVEPSRVEVKQAMSEGMLAAENQLRQMMGMELVDHSSFITIDDQDGYVFQTSQGITTLIGVPADAKVIDLDSAIGTKYDSVLLGSDAFTECSQLKQVIVGNKVSAIEPDAFEGCDGVTVTFPDECNTQLLGASTTNPFRFGADIVLDIPEKSQVDYLATWPMQCVGILDDFALGDYFFDIWIALWDEYPDGGPTAEQLNLAVSTPFLEQENYLRGLMGLEPIDDISQLEGYIDASGMAGLSEDTQREPVVAALSTLSAHHGSATEALEAAGLISSRGNETGKAIAGHQAPEGDAIVSKPVAEDKQSGAKNNGGSDGAVADDSNDDAAIDSDNSSNSIGSEMIASSDNNSPAPMPANEA